MLYRLLPAILVLVLTMQMPSAAHGGAVVDSAGRTVTVPDTIGRVFAAGPPASTLLYVLAPDRMIGWARAPVAIERGLLIEPYRDLPEIGRLTGRGDTANLEVVLRSQPDVIFDFGSIRQTYVSLADRVSAQSGVPYLLIDGRFAETPSSLRLMGDILGVAARAEMLAAYVEDLFAALDDVLAALPEDAQPRVYLARGADGLETGLQGSINTEIIERAGGRNVIDPGPDAERRRGLVRLSIEQVLVANPDTIITWDRAFYDRVWDDPLWADVKAVARKRVYLAPVAPFGWIDRPPSVNRVIGLRWLAGLFYPDRFAFDPRQDVREFYRLFYHIDLSDTQLDELIGGRP